MQYEIISLWLTHQIGWAIIHSIWQGGLLALLLALILRALPNLTSNARYGLCCLVLGLMLACPAATAYLFNPAAAAGGNIEETNPPPALNAGQQRAGSITITKAGEDKETVVPAGSKLAAPADFTSQMEKYFPWVILFWALGVLIFSIRLGGGFIYTRRLVKQAADPGGNRSLTLLNELVQKLGIKRTVKVFESALIQVPMTIGWLYPVILLPPSALLGLTPEQLQSIIAHELVHIKRHDYLVNLGQALVETLLFYHPAARWVSNKIRKEREFVCDDLTLALCENALVYARALTKVARFGNEANGLEMAATGGNLKSRIHRLVMNGTGQKPSRAASLQGILVISFFMLAAAAGTIAAFRYEKPRLPEVKDLPVSDEPVLPAQKPDKKEMPGLNIYNDDLSKENPAYRKIAVQALQGHRGSVVIMNPQTGQVYTIVNQDWAFRRSLTPASTFKLVTAIAGLEENILTNPEKGAGADNPVTLSNLSHAIAVSDNPYFKLLGKEIGSELLVKYARQAGFGSLTGINYDGETGGYLPDSTKIKGDLLGFSGEGAEVTPLQLAVFMSAIANGGKILVPIAVNEGPEITPQERDQMRISARTLTRIKKGLREVVESGTGIAADNMAGNVAGKTGTMLYKEENIGLFASYAGGDNPSVVVVVFLSGKNETGAIAAKVTGRVYAALNIN